MQEIKFLGSSKISPKFRMSLVKDVADEMGVKDGDHVGFYEKDGEIVIRKM